MKVWRLLLLCFVIGWTTWASAREMQQDLLKVSDISKIMQQILEHHVDQREVTKKILQHALLNYINTFDPERLFLLQSEINPFISLSDKQLSELTQQYKAHNFSLFEQLNESIQKAIIRSRQLRKEIEQEAKPHLFSFKGKSEPSLREKEERPFATNIDQLKSRLLENLESFIDIERRRYGDSLVAQSKNQILSAYEAHMREIENSYLYKDEEGLPLAEPEKENLFAIHVLKALASSLDSHTNFYKSNEAFDMRVRLQKEFEGIGIALKETAEGPMITRLLENSPAAKSGLIKSGDLLIEISGTSVVGLSFDKVMDRLHDTGHAEETLVFKRPVENEEAQVYSVKLKRETIILNDDRVDVSEQNFGNGIIGKITLHAFYQGDGVSSEKDVKDAIQTLEKKGPLKGLILDLRNNSGGFLSQAVKVAGLFITKGIIVISKYSDGEERIYRDVDGTVAYEGPLVILTSKMTASAAEIVAQALQDYGVALVVGDEHTYGKGTIQTQTVTGDRSGSYFKVTIGKYYTVSGKTPQKEGVKADILVPSRLNNEPIGEEYLDSPEDADQIPPAYQDNLQDITPDIKSWYLKYYIPHLQHKKKIWREMIPTLSKNSEKRIADNKNYQLYLKGEKPEEEGESEEEELMLLGKRKKDFGEDDLQLQEAVNIVKDMILLYTLEAPKEAPGKKGE